MAFFTALATAAGWSAGAITIAGAVGQVVGGMAVNALASALFAPDMPDQSAARASTTVQQGIVPRSFIVGRYATAGSLVYHTTMGASNDDENENYVAVYALSDLPVKGLTRLWIDGKECTVDGSAGVDPVHGTRIPEYADDEDDDGQIKAWFRFHDGTQTQADQSLIDYCSTGERPWSANEVGHGVAYIVMTLDYDPNLYQGLPRCLFELDGYEVWDPSTETMGAADRLPAAHIRRILAGISYNNVWLYGPQQAGVLPADVWGGSIEDCRAPVPGASGWSNAKKEEAFGSLTVPSRYRFGMEVSVDRPISDTIQDIATACNGRFFEVAGAWKFQVGNPPSAPAFTFTDADILRTREHSFTPFLPLAETVNGVTAVYPDALAQYEEQEAPPLYVPAYEAEDGNRRLTTTARMPAVPYKEQVQRLMKGALDEARRARRHTIVLPPKFWAIEPGDYGAWTSARNGYDAKLFRVDGVSDEPNGDVVLDITEVDPSDYDFDAEDFTPVVSGSIVQPGVPSYYVPNWSAAAVQGEKAIRVTWDSGRPGRGIDVRVFYAGTNNIASYATTQNYDSGEFIVANNIRGATDYDIQGRRVVRSGKAPWSSRIPVRTEDVRITRAELEQEILDELAAAFEAAESVAEYAEGINSVDVVDTLPTSGNYVGRIVFLTSDEKLHRYTGTGWTKEVPAVDVTGKLTDDQIQSIAAAKLLGDITETQIADGAISTGKLAANAIVASKIASGAIVADKIGANAITAGKISAGAVEASAIAADAITTDKIAANAVTAGTIAAGAVRAGEIAADAVRSSEIAADAVTAGSIATNAIIARHIRVAQITAAMIDTVDFRAAGIAIFDGQLKSPNYSTGSSGWSIFEGGYAEFNDIYIRTRDLAPSAIGEPFRISGDSSYNFQSPDGGYLLIDLNMFVSSTSGGASATLKINGATVESISVQGGQADRSFNQTIVHLIGSGSYTISLSSTSLGSSTVFRNLRAVNVKR